MGYTLGLVQKLTLMKNVWHLTRVDGGTVALGTIEQARMKLREEVKCHAPDGNLWFTIKARSMIELGATYDITDQSGSHLGTMTKDFGKSLGRSTYRIESPAGRWTITETSQVQAILRRVVGVLDLPWPFRVQFSIIGKDGNPVGHVNRANMRIKDTYEIRVDDDALDIRVGAAIGVAVDAFMNR